MAETNIKDVKLKIGTDEQFQSKLKDLPLNTLVGITDPIQEGELDSSIIDKLGKADNSLQKPTATLAKESFVKVGIDGTQKFDENSYVIAPSTDGTAGQVLKKTASGTEWADESGGGKLYKHKITFPQPFPYIITFFSKTSELFTKNSPYDEDYLWVDGTQHNSNDNAEVVGMTLRSNDNLKDVYVIGLMKVNGSSVETLVVDIDTEIYGKYTDTVTEL